MPLKSLFEAFPDALSIFLKYINVYSVKDSHSEKLNKKLFLFCFCFVTTLS